MGAPKKNEFWMLRKTHGRKKAFESPEQLLEECLKYFEFVDENPDYKYEAIKSGMNAGELIAIPVKQPYTELSLCLFLGIDHETWRRYAKLESHKDYRGVVTYVNTQIRDQKMRGAASGFFNANIIARDLGLVDKKEQTVNATNYNVEMSKEEIKDINKNLEGDY